MRDAYRAERCSNGGFSLIELSIVLIVMGLLLIPFVKAYDVYQTQKRLDDTKVNLSLVNTALANFYGVNGRYPCPADRSLGFDDAGHGVEQCATAPATPIGLQVLAPDSCGGARSRGFCRTQNGPNNVYIGAIPYVTLDIPGSSTPGSQTIDGWKNNFTYAVTASMTVESTFDPNLGAVRINNEHGTNMGSVHGIVISHGKDGMGGFNVDGFETLCVAGTVQDENCDNDDLFVSSINLYEADGATYYDDIVMSNDWTQSGIWAYVTGVDIANTNPGNIGIGTRTPGVKLDVIGDVRSSSKLRTGEFCNDDGTICFRAANIGGTGMHCPGGDDEIAYGIQNNTLVCRSPFELPTINNNCPHGSYVTAVSPAGVTCAVLPTP